MYPQLMPKKKTFPKPNIIENNLKTTMVKNKICQDLYFIYKMSEKKKMRLGKAGRSYEVALRTSNIQISVRYMLYILMPNFVIENM